LKNNKDYFSLKIIRVKKKKEKQSCFMKGELFLKIWRLFKAIPFILKRVKVHHLHSHEEGKGIYLFQ